MNNIIIKDAEKKDSAVLYELLKNLAVELGKEEHFKSTVYGIEKFGFSVPPSFEAILAWKDDIPLGFVLFFYEFSTWRGRPGIYVQDLFVSPDARGLGLGEKLISAAVGKGKEKGAVYMRLSIHKGNDTGAEFYKALGFATISDETILLLEGAAFDDKI